jgi:hypothetical protein
MLQEVPESAEASFETRSCGALLRMRAEDFKRIPKDRPA